MRDRIFVSYEELSAGCFSDGIVTDRAAKPTVVGKITDHTQLVREDGSHFMASMRRCTFTSVRPSAGRSYFSIKLSI